MKKFNISSEMVFKIERLSVTAFVVLACAVSFLYVNDLNSEIAQSGGRFTQLHTWVDNYIPLLPDFVYFYYLYYVWVVLTAVAVTERDSFYHAAAAFAVLQTLAISTFIIFPSKMSRPEIVGVGWSEDMVRTIYSLDVGFNLLPSLHVGHSVLVALAFWTYKRSWFPFVALGTFLITLSTVFIKQHYIIDIPFGLLYAVVAFYVTVPVSQFVQSYQQRA